MAAEIRTKSPLLAVSDADWAGAVQRESVLCPLSTWPRVGLPAASAAASALGLSKPRIYGLLCIPSLPGKRDACGTLPSQACRPA
jgi:hypothetical protein